MNYFGGCDAGSTYTKSVIIDETGAIKTSVINKSRINPVLSAVRLWTLQFPRWMILRVQRI